MMREHWNAVRIKQRTLPVAVRVLGLHGNLHFQRFPYQYCITDRNGMPGAGRVAGRVAAVGDARRLERTRGIDGERGCPRQLSVALSGPGFPG